MGSDLMAIQWIKAGKTTWLYHKTRKSLYVLPLWTLLPSTRSNSSLVYEKEREEEYVSSSAEVYQDINSKCTKVSAPTLSNNNEISTDTMFNSIIWQ
ncbi:hypothetical protein Y1Q_0007839 [Alligator mississippiensis]|uniref:Uncharacterized protein n=1 Tax=Alligator mississippiensis TaxID=8496 RepID=A0A151N7D5_ALLMI|nr:hypothetical protein Y1Q_0007839 [Alligator mississippiensis]